MRLREGSGGLRGAPWCYVSFRGLRESPCRSPTGDPPYIGTLGAAAVTFACASLLSTHVAAMNLPAAKVYESLIPIAVVGLLEAYTQQIDNVVLPVVFSTLVLVL